MHSNTLQSLLLSDLSSVPESEAKIEQGIKLLLEGIGEDADREGLKDTPDRVARMYEEFF